MGPGPDALGNGPWTSPRGRVGPVVPRVLTGKAPPDGRTSGEASALRPAGGARTSPPPGSLSGAAMCPRASGRRADAPREAPGFRGKLALLPPLMRVVGLSAL